MSSESSKTYAEKGGTLKSMSLRVTPPFGIHTLSYATIPQKVEVGGAIIFAVDVYNYEKI